MIIYPVVVSELHREVDASLRLAAGQAAGLVEEDDDRLVFGGQDSEDEVLPARLVSEGYAVRLLSREGRLLDGFGAIDLLPKPSRDAGGGFMTVDTKNGPWRVYNQWLPGRRGMLQAGESLTRVQETLARLRTLYTIFVPLTVFFASLGGFLLANRALRPVDKITNLAKAVQAESLDARLGLDLPNDEIGRLASTFDQMLGRLQAAFERQRQFTADAAHELRTPLAAMKGDIGVTLNRERSATEYRDNLVRLEGEVDRLTTLVEELLLLARFESNRESLQLEELDLAELLETVAEQLEPLAAEKQMTLYVEAPASLTMVGDAGQLIRLFLNLFDNAVKYGPAGSRVTISAGHAAKEAEAGDGRGTIEVSVHDRGPGIPEEHLPHIFKRFYRADQARTRGRGATGLGLAISREIVRAHGGELSAGNSPAGGAIFTASFPTSRSNEKNSHLIFTVP